MSYDLVMVACVVLTCVCGSVTCMMLCLASSISSLAYFLLQDFLAMILPHGLYICTILTWQFCSMCALCLLDNFTLALFLTVGHGFMDVGG